jgi:DNA-binding transcriptional MerR regulator/methylmalonyl-CoA mutase cobalamin-binding subunit
MDDILIPRHPIRVVAQRTGLTTATIRAWERRYDAVRPSRSEGGQRLYSDHDVDRLRTLRELTGAGRAISMVAGLSDVAAADLLSEDRAASVTESLIAAGSETGGWVDQAYAQVQALDANGLERTLWQAAMQLGARSFLDEVVGDLLDLIGASWVAGKINPAQEHLGSEVLDRVLEGLVDRSRNSGGPVLVVATLPGERHGLGARLVSVAAMLEGWNVTYLGTDLPVEDIASTAEILRATAVAISVVGRDDPHRTRASLIALRQRLNPDLEILVGGRGSSLIDARGLPNGVTLIEGLEGLRKHRSAIRAPVAGSRR